MIIPVHKSFAQVLMLVVITSGMLTAQQNPSPMQENTRLHERISDSVYCGNSYVLDNILPKPVKIFVPAGAVQSGTADLLLHFHGAAYVVDYTAASHDEPLIGVSIELGSGSSVYSRPFEEQIEFADFYEQIVQLLRQQLSGDFAIRHVWISGFSAGYGAVRAILAKPENRAIIHGALLLDGIHAGYIPPQTVLYKGGRIDSTDLTSFSKFARFSSERKNGKGFLITHSTVFPGTFVSTTEATDYLLNQLNLTRKPVLEWGPNGMQQLSIAGQGRFRVMGFAGNSGQDHGDHLHGLPSFLKDLEQLTLN